MDTQVDISSTIQLIEKNAVVYTLKIDRIDSYEFSFDSENLSTLSFIVSNLNMKALDILVSRPFECYVLMAKKKITSKEKIEIFEIPAKAYKYMTLEDNGKYIKFYFKQKKGNNNE